jgi:hypothetical protein
LLLLLASLPNVAGFSTVDNFPTDSTWRSAAVDIHDVSYPAAAVVSDVDYVLVVVGPPAWCWRLH